jgi:hypothetical protein
MPGNISKDAPDLSVPFSPPEPVQWDSWETSWNGRFRQPGALSSLKKAALPFFRAPAAEYNTPAGEKSDISCFRRIHVVPFQGDILRSVIDIGTRYRDLLLKYASSFDPDKPQLPPGFSETLKGILDELDTLRKTNIALDSELEARQGPADAKTALLQWMTRTTDLLQHLLKDPLLRPRVSETQINALIEWLRPPTLLDPPPSNLDRGPHRSTLADDYLKQVYRSRLRSRRQMPVANRRFGLLHEDVDPSDVAAVSYRSNDDYNDDDDGGGGGRYYRSCYYHYYWRNYRRQ